jgi:choline dehydrogenase-like flavoprotein
VIEDASAVPDGTALAADVCVVGAGPAGIVVTERLAAAGLDVCLLESGGAVPDAASRRAARAQRVGYPYFPVQQTRLRALGGTSHDWPLVLGWRARPLDPVDLEARSGLPGWPLSYEELAAWYPAAQERCGLGPFDYEAEAWAGRDDHVLLPLDPGAAGTAVFQYSRRDFTDLADLGREPRVRVLTHATVTQLRTDTQPDLVDAVVVRGPSGTFTVRAQRVVLACGGLDNARLLLASTGTHPRGLGNDHDLVGRYFMERLTTRTGVVRPVDPRIGERLGFYDIHDVDGVGVQGVLTLPPDVLRAAGLRNAAFFCEVRDAPATSEGIRSLATLLHVRDRRPLPPRLLGHARAVVGHAGDVARTVRGRLTRRSGDPVLLLRVQAEPSPSATSRVTLSDRRDAHGLPRVRLDWRIDDDDRTSIRESQARLGAALEQAGIGRLVADFGDEDPPALFEGAHHHLGTTRMAASPHQGVVDPDGRVHTTANLYVAGSSVFPRAGYANPTLTIVALALRLAEHLRTGLAPGTARGTG